MPLLLLFLFISNTTSSLVDFFQILTFQSAVRHARTCRSRRSLDTLDSLRTLAAKPQTVGFLLPEIDKHTFFKDVEKLGVLPRKTFSMGEADEKRFYMEAKSIQE